MGTSKEETELVKKQDDGNQASEFYTVTELMKRIHRSRGWILANAKDIPGAKETFPKSGKYIFRRSVVDAYYFS